jgi:Flp pilus assembly secretin CpaC
MSKVAVALSLSVLALTSCASTTPNETAQDSSRSGADRATPKTAAPAVNSGSSATEASAPVSQDDPGAFLEQERERLSLQEQKKREFVDALVGEADALVDRQLYREAFNTLMRAAAYSPDDLDVRNRLEFVGPLVGEELPAVVKDEAVDSVNVRDGYFVAQAKDAIRKGQLAIGRRDFDAAVFEFEVALDYVRFAPGVDWTGVREEAESLLAQTKATRADSERQARRAEEDLTLQRLRDEEAGARAREQARLDSLLADGISAFETEAYETAQLLATEVLRDDPRNERAQELYDTAFKARREELSAEYLDSKQTQFRKWKAHILSQRIPYADVLQLPDKDAWRELTELRAPLSDPNAGSSENASDAALRARLDRDQVRGLRIDGVESLMAVARQIQALTDVPIAVSSAAENAVFDEGVTYELELNNPISIAQALNLVAEQSGEEVTWTIDVGAVLFTTKERARGKLISEYYDIHDLVLPLPNFIAPRIERIRLLEDLEDEDGGTPWGTIGESSIQLEPDALAELITTFVAVGSWEQDGVSAAAYNSSGIFVVHTLEVQREVNQFLEDLRRFTSMMVTVDTKFLTVTDAWLQQIGVDWRGLNNPGTPFTDMDDFTNGNDDGTSNGFDNGGQGNNPAGPPSSGFFYDDGQDGNFKARTENIFDSSLGQLLSSVGGLTTQLQIVDDALLSPLLRAVEKSSEARVVNSQVLTVYNSQQAAVSVINQRAYVQDFDVEVATAAFIADPIINVLSEGVSLQVRPTVHQDRKNLTLEVQPTVARIVTITPFTTTLGNNSAAAITLQLPQLEVQSLRSTATIPDGGTILIGGLNSIRNVERRAEVPWLGKIPILGFFFKDEGYSDETTSLMILMNARITDIRDEAARLAD